MSSSGAPIGSNGWTNQPNFRLSASLGSPDGKVDLVPEVEFVPLGQPFAGKPNITGSINSASVRVAPALLASGQRYHWQIRGREPGGQSGPWVPFEGFIGYDAQAPPSPDLEVPNGGFLSTKQFQLNWQAIAGPSGLAGFSYSFDQTESGQPPDEPNTKMSEADVTLPTDGDWYFHLRTRDNAGNWSPVTTVALHVDSAPLKVTDMLYRTFAYNPNFDTLPMKFTLSKRANLTLTILPAQSSTPLRTYKLGPDSKFDVEWDGKDQNGTVVAPGNYRFRIVAQDKFGHTLDATYDKLLVSEKRIVVSLSQQKMWAYSGDKAVLISLVTTGGPLLPTPEGTFQILSKQTDFVFHSPWPKGSPFWYPDSPTHFAMMFDTDGYFIHDAPWRHKFGPGSNLVAGQPGEETSGTHGCVNVPLDVQTKLFAWTDPGTPVVVQQ